MTKEKYSRAYTEVLVMLRCLSEDEYKKIPKEKINFFEENKDKNYEFNIKLGIPLEEQKISIEANSIIVSLYRDYFATEEEKEMIEFILANNEYRKNLNMKNNFTELTSKEKNLELEVNSIENKNLPIKIKKENFFKKLVDYIKKLIFRI